MGTGEEQAMNCWIGKDMLMQGRENLIEYCLRLIAAGMGHTNEGGGGDA